MSADRPSRPRMAQLRETVEQQRDTIDRLEKLLRECRAGRRPQLTFIAWLFLSLGGACAWLLTMAWYNL